MEDCKLRTRWIEFGPQAVLIFCLSTWVWPGPMGRVAASAKKTGTINIQVSERSKKKTPVLNEALGGVRRTAPKQPLRQNVAS